jgi:L-ascorbate metabolism protein UlaG (beta-lactamase superfamily)
VLDYDKAYALAVQLEPKAIIPMHYEPQDLKNFLKEAGEDVKPQEKLTIKKKDLDGKEGEIVVLQV